MTNIAVFSSKKWVTDSFGKNLPEGINVKFFEARLSRETAALSDGYDGVCVFVNDDVSKDVLDILAAKGIGLVALRCAGFNNVDIEYAAKKGITVVRVPAYSPFAVAEHALGLILALNRKYYRAYNRVRDGNFSLDGLLGFDIHGKTVGIIGTGKIGQIFAGLMAGFGCRLLAYDKFPSKELEARGVEYVDLETLYKESDIISLHCPLTHETYHLINTYAIRTMKEGIMIINTSRGPLIDSDAVIWGMKEGIIGYLGLDVYEEEGDLFFEDLSDQVIQDDTFVRLETFPNVLITAHQAFFTKEAVDNIAATTFENIQAFFNGTPRNVVEPSTLIRKSGI
ncbi:MAG: 2-hydroxyacid dehydrogenase [Spirochaetales bacterium]|nr:2-hydroxyacid dehydrogenase [Spirochaetales bacterium]